MTKSEMFKAAHKLAAAYKLDGNGDYVICFLSALINIRKSVKDGYADEVIFKALNKRIAKASDSLPLITKPVKIDATHGLMEFDAAYQLEKARKNLDAGKSFGKVFRKGSKVCAWVCSERIEHQAY